jgi:hypothetical protein
MYCDLATIWRVFEADLADDQAVIPRENATRTFVASVECRPGLTSVKSAKVEDPG